MNSTRDIPAKLKRRVLVEAGHRCAIPTCRSFDVDLHHIIPFSKTEKHEYKNLIALCPNCHRRAEKGEIDRQSLFMYKDNLRYVIDKYSSFEIDLLMNLAQEPEKALVIPAHTELLFWRIKEEGLVEHIETPVNTLAVRVKGIEDTPLKLTPDLIQITGKGKRFVDSISRQKIGYERVAEEEVESSRDAFPL
jgi:hypothetical protein